MRSSERRTPAGLLRSAMLGLACCLIACDSPVERPAKLASVPAAVVCPSPAGSLSAARAAELAALRATTERGPLFAAMAAGRVPACTVGDDGSQWQLDYRFGDDARLSVTRNASIEYTDITAQMPWPANDDPRELLQHAERASFSPAGCGIDWHKPAESSATAQVWRGDVCQCQARVQRDIAGRVVSLGLRSAC